MGSGPYISRPGDTHRPYSQDKKSPFDNGRFDTERPFSARDFDTERSFGTHAYIERPLSGLAGASSGGFLGEEPLEPFLSGRQVSSQRGSGSQRGGPEGGVSSGAIPPTPRSLSVYSVTPIWRDRALFTGGVSREEKMALRGTPTQSHLSPSILWYTKNTSILGDTRLWESVL